MSDLGAIFHVKKDEVQYDAHAYTTTDECPFPNLKLKYKGQQAYVKMEQGKGNGDVPCYVKDKDGVIYQVKQEVIATPTGSIAVGEADMFTVPPGVKVIQVYWDTYEYDDTSHSVYTYVGVTPGKTYELQCHTFLVWPFGEPDDREIDGVYLGSISGTTTQAWFQRIPDGDIKGTRDLRGFLLSWSPAINNMKPTYTDY